MYEAGTPRDGVDGCEDSRTVEVLFLTTLLPGGGESGGEIVSQSMIDALDELGNVTTVGYRRAEDPTLGGQRDVCVGRRPIETSGAGLRSLFWMARALAEHEPYSATKYRSRSFARAVTDQSQPPPAVVLVDHAQVYFTLSALTTEDVPIVFIAHNIEAESYRRLASEATNPVMRWLHKREARLIGQQEMRLANRARQIWALTEDDARFVRGLGPLGADVRVLPAASRVVASPLRRSDYDIGLIGTWTWRPNRLGLEWFAREVMPRLPDGLQVHVAGRGAEWLSDRFANLTVRGLVADAQVFLERARAVAVPAVAGSGVQIKTLDAIASGVPVVATTVATRGLHPLPASVAVATDPADFANHLVRLTAGSPNDRPDARAVAWSRERQVQFRNSVQVWVRELIDPRTDPKCTSATGRT